MVSSFFTADQQALHFSKQKFSLSYLDSLSDASPQWGDSLAALAESINDQDSRRVFTSMDVLQDPFNFTIDTFSTFALMIFLNKNSEGGRYDTLQQKPLRGNTSSSQLLAPYQRNTTLIQLN